MSIPPALLGVSLWSRPGNLTPRAPFRLREQGRNTVNLGTWPLARAAVLHTGLGSVMEVTR